MVLSIIICTYNRGDVLQDCLERFAQQTERNFELVIVDNASTDSTPQIIEEFSRGREAVRSVKCPELGLSHARNCGADASRAEWIGYIDDDALVEPEFVANVLAEIALGEFTAFGGVYTPWYKYGRPCWYSDTYAGNAHYYDEGGRRELEPNEHFSGGIAFYLRKAIAESCRFPSDFGMKGDLVGYGEELVVQDSIRSLGYTLGMVPSIRMQHLVAEYKLGLKWHLRAQWMSGKSHTRQFGRESLLKGVLKLSVLPFLRLRELPKGGFKSLTSSVCGGLVLVLRGFSYYAGRMDFRKIEDNE